MLSPRDPPGTYLVQCQIHWQSLAISGNLWIIYRTTRLESGLDGAQVSSGAFVMGLAHEGSRAMGPSSNLQPRPLQPR